MARPAGTEVLSQPIPNLIQGVSQQAAQQRRDTQCDAQFDCVNSPLDGCLPRPHAQFLKRVLAAQFAGAFTYEIKRGNDEHYLVVVANTDDPVDEEISGHRLRVYNLDTGAPCTVTYTASEAYLEVTGEDAKRAMRACTIEDNTFLVNNQVLPAMDTGNVAPAEENAALIYFKAGGYKMTFVLAVTYNGFVYTYKYVSPDNSTAANAEYITTNVLAATFARAMTQNALTPTASGTAASGTNQNAGPANEGQTTGMTGAQDLETLGFSVAVIGNVIKLSRADSNAFKVDTSDGAGDTYFKAVKGSVQAFTDLPKAGFNGFTVKVRGQDRQADDDYWLKYDEGEGTQGAWKEVPKPGTVLGFDAETMPHLLVNTGLNTFEFKEAPWGERVSGDGVVRSQDPYFVGRKIEDILPDNGRLLIITEGTANWSRARNPFVWFPDSAQKVLDTDPILERLSDSKTIALARTAVQKGGDTFIWALGQQFRVHSGNDPFKQSTIQIKGSTNYEFSERCRPELVGESLYFTTESGQFTTMRDLVIIDGKVRGDPEVTSHIKRYIPKDIETITASDTLGFVFLHSTQTPSRLYVYNYLIGDKERLQSAWQTWRLPEDCEIIWCAVYRNYLKLLVQYGDDAMFLTMDLTPGVTDEDPGAQYLTRLDLRVTEAQCEVLHADGVTTITLPYPLLGSPTAEDLFVVQRVTSDVAYRGAEWPIVDIDGANITVEGDLSEEMFYIGYRITAARKESAFYVRDREQGALPVDELTVKDYTVSHDTTGYYRAEVTTREVNPREFRVEFTGRVLGSPDNLFGQHVLTSGQLRVPIDKRAGAYDLWLINDSYLPSKWQSAEYTYTMTKRSAGKGRP